MMISQISPKINNNYAQRSVANAQNVNFTATPKFASNATKSKFFEPFKKFFAPIGNKYEQFTEYLAKQFGKLLGTKQAKKIIKATNKHEKFSNKLVQHLMTTGSIVLSGFYIKKTLDNDKLDANKKRTLAINQAAVWGVSTTMCYTLDGAVNKKIDKFIERYKTLNYTKVSASMLEKYEGGIKNAKSIMIFDMIYRYFAPVLVTPIANKIGNHIQEKNEAKLAINNTNK